MEKNKYSKLTDDQHRQIVLAIRRLEIEAESSLTAADSSATDLKRFIRKLEGIGFITPAERKAYFAEIENVMSAAADKAVAVIAERLSVSDGEGMEAANGD